MAKEYIEREVAKEKITEEKEFYASSMMNPTAYDIGYCNGLTMAFSLLLNTPAADVVEVRHGRWVHNEDYEDWAEKYVCSECNRNAPSDGDYRHGLTDCCPHCGAKMDKEE